jgi:hypothetical protein
MWAVLIVVGIFVNTYVASHQSGTVQFLAVLVTFWEAFIYLFTALKNPGIATARNPHDPDLERFVDYPK